MHCRFIFMLFTEGENMILKYVEKRIKIKKVTPSMLKSIYLFQIQNWFFYIVFCSMFNIFIDFLHKSYLKFYMILNKVKIKNISFTSYLFFKEIFF